MTQSEISTIAYGTTAFLSQELAAMRQSGILSEYMLICHDRDTSSDGSLKKAHHHIWAVPARRIDQTAFRESLTMAVPGELPLRAMEVRKSKRSDWVLYVLHHPEYLASKTSSSDGKFEYSLSDIVHSDGIDIQELYLDALGLLSRSSSSVTAALLSGTPPADLALQGVPPSILSALTHILPFNFSPLSREERRSYDAVSDRLNRVLLALNDAGLTYYPPSDGSPPDEHGRIVRINGDDSLLPTFEDLTAADRDFPFSD